MKLSRLSLRYLRKQKSRSLLTLFCVFVALYLLSVLGMFASSTLATLANFAKKVEGCNEVIVYNRGSTVSLEQRLLNALAEQEPDVASGVEDIFSGQIQVDFPASVLDNLRASDQLKNFHTIRVGDLKSGYWSYNCARPALVFSMGDTTMPIWKDHLTILSGTEADFAMLDAYNRPTLAEGTYPQAVGELAVPLGWKTGQWVGNTAYSVADPACMKPVAIGDTITFTLQPAVYRLDESSPTVRSVLNLDAPDDEQEEMDEEDRERAERKKNEQKLARARQFFNLYGCEEWVSASENDGNWLTLLLQEPVTCTYKVVGYTGENQLVTSPSDQQLASFYRMEQLGFDTKDHRMVIPSAEFFGILQQAGISSEQIDEAIYCGTIFPNGPLLAAQFRVEATLTELAFIFAFVALVVLFVVAIARLVIDNAFEISTQERVQQYAVLRTIGASKWQIMRLILQEAACYLVLSISLAMVAAYATVQTLATKISAEGLSFPLWMGSESIDFTSLIAVRIFPSWVLIIIIIGIWSVGISAYTSAQKAASIPPMAAMSYGRPTDLTAKKKRPRAARKEKPNKKRSDWVQHIFGFSFRYATLNLRRNRRRYRLTILSTMLALTTFTLGITGILTYQRVRQIMLTTTKDFTVELFSQIDEANRYMTLDTVKAMEQSGFFTEVHVSSAISVLTDETFRQSAMVDCPYLNIRTVTETEYNAYIAAEAGMSYPAFRQSGGLLLPAYAYQEDDFTGQTIRSLQEVWNPEQLPACVTYEMYTRTKRNTNQSQTIYHTIPVIGSFDGRNYIEHCGGMDVQYVALIALENFDALRFDAKRNMIEYTYEDNKFNGDYAQSPAFFISHVSANAAEGQLTAAQQWLETFSMDTVTSSIYDNIKDVKQADQVASIVTDIGLALVLVLFFICAANIVNTMHTAVRSRRREYAMLRAVGLSPQQLRASVMLEAGFYTTLSAIPGVALSAGMMLLFLRLLEVTLQDWWQDLLLVGVLSAAVAVCIAVCATIVPLRRLEHDAIAETIREIE